MRVLVFVLAASTCFAADPNLVRMLPAETKMVAGVDVSRSAASPLGHFLVTRLQNDEGLRQFVAKTGFDPTRNVTEVLAANTGDHRHGLVLISGTFDVNGLVNLAKNSDATVMSYKGASVITGAQPEAGWFALLPDGRTAIAGEPGLVRGAIDARGAGAAQIDSAMQAKINQLGAAYEAWAVSRLPVGQFAPQAPNAQIGGAMKGAMMQAIDQTSGGLKLNQDPVRIEGEALARTDKDANALADVIRFLASMATANTANTPEGGRIATVLNTLQVNTVGNTLTMSVTVPEAQLEQWIQEGPQNGAKKRARRASLENGR